MDITPDMDGEVDIVGAVTTEAGSVGLTVTVVVDMSGEGILGVEAEGIIVDLRRCDLHQGANWLKPHLISVSVIIPFHR